MTTTRTTPSPFAFRRACRHGGVAMLLVLVCMVVGTIMAAVALTTQDTAPAMGQNASDTAASAWAAESAADLAVAAMQTEADWTNGTPNLITNFTFAGGKVDVTVTDLDGNPPDDNDREVIVTASGVVGGVTTNVQKRVTITRPAELSEAIDPHLGEFALFAKNKLTIQTGATISEWNKSPESGTSMPVKIGTGFASSADLTVATDATVSRVKAYSDAVASTTLDSAASSAAPMSGKVPLIVPAYPEVLPSAITSLPTMATMLNYNGVAASGSLASASRYTSLTVQNGAKLVIDAATVSRCAFGSLGIRSGGILIIRGNVVMAIYGNTNIATLGSIVLDSPSSSLTLYTTGNITIDNATIGAPVEAATDSTRTASCLTNYVRAGSIKILPVSTASGGAANPTITIGTRSIVCANIHAPTANIHINGASWIVGRVTGYQVGVNANSGILYDPAYDNRVAFTNRRGPLYDADGNPVDGLVDALASFNPSSGCQSLRTFIPETVATLTGVITEVVEGVGGLLGGLLGGGGGGNTSPISQTNTPSTKSKLRAEARVLPSHAMSLEGKQTVASYDDDISDNADEE